MTDLAIHFEGPYALHGDGAPSLAAAPSSNSRGIYLWTVPLQDEYRVNYVGKAARPLRVRLAEEVDYYLSGQDGYWDVDAYRRGIRRACAPDREVLRPVLECTRIFLAPIDGEDRLIRRVESALIRCFRAGGPELSAFLANRNCQRPGRPPLQIAVTCDARIQGLAPIVSG